MSKKSKAKEKNVRMVSAPAVSKVPEIDGELGIRGGGECRECREWWFGP